MADTVSANMCAEAALSSDGLGFLLVFTTPLGAGLLPFSGMHNNGPTSFSQKQHGLLPSCALDGLGRRPGGLASEWQAPSWLRSTALLR